jgi:hypothetical protein
VKTGLTGIILGRRSFWSFTVLSYEQTEREYPFW